MQEDALLVGKNRLIEELRATATGLVILNEWFGEGGVPVSRSTAERRAMVCLDCPKNRDKFWWETAKDAVAIAIRWHLAVKNQLKLSTPMDKDLGVCNVCKCCLPLKIWAPIEILEGHLPKTTKNNDFPAFCWIRQEIESHAI